MSVEDDEEAEAGEARSGRGELMQVVLGVGVFAFAGPVLLGLVLFLGVIAVSVGYDAVEALIEGRRFDPTISAAFATGVMLVVMRFGWAVVWGGLLVPNALCGAAIALKRAMTGGAGLGFVVATGIVVGVIADLAFLWPGLGFFAGTRFVTFAGFVVAGSLIATLACWHLAGLRRR